MRILVGFVCTMAKSHGHDHSRNVTTDETFHVVPGEVCRKWTLTIGLQIRPNQCE